MSEEELLLQLRDIPAPPEPAWWLLAPGHLGVLSLVILLLGGGWLILRHRRANFRANRLAKLAEYELQLIKSDFHHHRDPRQLATRLSCWLKQVALEAYPARQLQCLSGQAWLEFLDSSLGDSRFTQGCGQVFGAAVYRAQVSLDADQVFALCTHWLQAIRPRLQQRGRVQ
jgi:hypothetical protein